jgi:lipoprotein signal peptidase
VRLRLAIVVCLALALSGIDLLVNALVPAASWDYHQRSQAWSVLLSLLLLGLGLLALVPSRVAACAAGGVAGGVLGSLVAAAAHGGAVPDPLVAGDTAFNLGDVLIVGAVPVLMISLAASAIRHRGTIDRHIPPRRWELALRRKLGL